MKRMRGLLFTGLAVVVSVFFMNVSGICSVIESRFIDSEYIEGELLIRLRPGIEISVRKSLGDRLKDVGIESGADKFFSFERALRGNFASVSGESALLRWYKLEFDAGLDVMSVRRQVLESGNVEHAEPNIYVYALETPNDPCLENQWALEQIMAFQGWDYVHGDASVPIAIIDTGVDINHPDLHANMWRNEDEQPGNGIDDDGNGYIDDYYGYDFVNNDGCPMDDNSHGTHVGGIASAVTNNGKGIAGVAWNCSLMALKTLSAGGGGSVQNSAAGICYAADNGARVINMSYGHSGSPHQLESDAVDYAYAAGVVMAGASGNGGADGIGDPVCDFPGGYEKVITVGSSTRFDTKSMSSNYGVNLDVLAPGDPIYSTYWEDGEHTYSNASGTSMASPHVAGLAGLILSCDPDLTPDQVKSRIKSSCDNVDHLNPEFTGELGAGRINLLYAAVPTSYLEIIDWVVEDVNESCSHRVNGYLDSGEEIELSLFFKNQSWKAASDIEVELLDTNPYINLTNPETDVCDLTSKAEAEASSAILFSVKDNVPYNTETALEFEITTQDTVRTVELPMFINHPYPGFRNWPVKFESFGVYGSSVLADIDDDGLKEIIVGDDSGTLHVLNINGEENEGWPVQLDPETDFAVISSPGVGDIDGDGVDEIVLPAYYWVGNDPTGCIYVFNADGTAQSGWPACVNGEFKSAPALYDLDDDGKLEVIIGSYDNQLHIFRHNGTCYPGWPQSVGNDIFSSAAVGDIDADGEPEIVVGVKDESLENPEIGKVEIFKPDGTRYPGWPKIAENQVYSSPALADLDQDGDLEIIVGCGDYSALDPGNRLYIWHHDGTCFPGWPVIPPNSCYSSPAIGDLNGDGSPEIAIGCLGEEGGDTGVVAAYDLNGNLLDGWPVETGGRVYSSPAIADIDDDGYNEVVIGSSGQSLSALNYNGSFAPGWPVQFEGEVFSSPSIDDVDADGDLEIAFSTMDAHSYLLNLSSRQRTQVIPWKKFRNTLENTGFYSKISTGPKLLLGGYWDTSVKFSEDGTLTLLAFVTDVDGDLESVELCYDGIDTGLELTDEGFFGDNDGFYGITIDLQKEMLPTALYRLEIIAKDEAGNESKMWPYLNLR